MKQAFAERQAAKAECFASAPAGAAVGAGGAQAPTLLPAPRCRPSGRGLAPVPARGGATPARTVQAPGPRPASVRSPSFTASVPRSMPTCTSTAWSSTACSIPIGPAVSSSVPRPGSMRTWGRVFRGWRVCPLLAGSCRWRSPLADIPASVCFWDQRQAVVDPQQPVRLLQSSRSTNQVNRRPPRAA